MAIDGLLLHTINKQLQGYLPCKLAKIQQVSEFELLLTIRFQHHNYKLFISLHSSYNRINITNQNYTTLETPSNFVMLLRKQCDQAIITSSMQIGLDRILKLELEARDELGDIHKKYLYLELMGKYANVVLVDDHNMIIDAMKRIPPFENNKRTILPNVNFKLPDAQKNKLNPLIDNKVDLNIALYQQFHGFSPLLSKEVEYRLNRGENFKQIMNMIINSNTIYLYEKKDDYLFHSIPLTHLEAKCHSYPLMHGFDILFYEKEKKVRIKAQSGDLIRLVKKELTKNQNKLKKLYSSLEEAMDNDKYREYGDLLFAYMHQIKKAEVITLTSFTTNEEVKIPIDMRYDIKYNANHYYQKYHKLKRAQSILDEQIELCQKEINYFELLTQQLSQADVLDAMEIREELVKQGYLRAKSNAIRRKKKNERPHYDIFEFDDYRIYVGKNNLQNDYVTWKLAHKNDTWFHVKDLHGSHVVINASECSEEMIRNAAMLAAFYSQGRYSSSVPVNYCLVKALKKIPGNKGSLVSLSTYKTIYIDPDINVIQALIDDHRQ